MTKGVYKNKGMKGAECTDTLSGRLKPGIIDQYYIDVYINNPKMSQHDVLKLAMIDAEIPGNTTRQWANKIHDRNRDEINKAMVKIASDLKNLSISVIKDLMLNADSESVRLSAAQTGTKDIFPNVSIKTVKTIDDLDQANSDLIKQIAAEEGKSISQVINEIQNPVQH